MEKKIVECEIVEEKYQNRVSVKYDDGSVECTLGLYYPDEISFNESEFIGLTRQQAKGLMEERDKAYLWG